MRRASAVVAAVGLALALASASAGFFVAGAMREAVQSGVAVVAPAGGTTLGLAHVATGLAAAVAAALVASMAFLLGLQGLLESERRRGRLAALARFAFGPALMAAAVAALVSGHAEWRDVHVGRLREQPFESFLHAHGVLATALLLGALTAYVLAAAVARARRSDDDEEGLDEPI